MFSSSRIQLIRDPIYQDYENITRRKTRFELILISLIVCGIELCYAAETALVTPLLLELGIPVQYMSLVWSISPLFGFIFCSLLGKLSDKCKLKFGKRRPFILLHSIGIITGIILISYSNSITSDKFLTMLLTILGVFLLDFNCDACQSPSRAYLFDVCIPADHSIGLSTFTVMAGLGGCVGYLFGSIPWDQLFYYNENNLSTIKHIRIIFSSVLVFYIICLIFTITSFKEIPITANSDNYCLLEWSTIDSDDNSNNNNIRSKIREQFHGILEMPQHIFILCLANFFCWISLICYSLYFTDFVAQTIFHGLPNKSSEDSYSHYQEGVRFGSFCMALYSISCSIYSLSYKNLLNRFNIKAIYMLGQLVYSLGMLILALTKNKTIAILVSPTAGIMYSTLFTIPYILISKYQSDENVIRSNTS
jgi:solute carrier family 45, member 1/2/4